MNNAMFWAGEAKYRSSLKCLVEKHFSTGSFGEVFTLGGQGMMSVDMYSESRGLVSLGATP